MAEQLTSISELDPKTIVIGKRLRPASDAGVAAVKASIVELDTMKDRIHVRKKRDGNFHLLAGLHRLTAVLELKWQTIPVVAWTCTDDWARLMEIDDNLAGAELTPLDTAIFLAERKRVYEKMHPETKAGVAGGLARQNSASDMMSFAETTAEKFGLSKRHVERIVAAGSALDHDAIRWLRAAPAPVTLSDLQTLAKVTPEQRGKVCIALTNGEAKSAAKALKQLSAKPGDKGVSDTDKKARALNDAFARANKAARRQFATEHADDLRDLLADLDDDLEGDVVAFTPRLRAAE